MTVTVTITPEVAQFPMLPSPEVLANVNTWVLGHARERLFNAETAIQNTAKIQTVHTTAACKVEETVRVTNVTVTIIQVAAKSPSLLLQTQPVSVFTKELGLVVGA